MKKKLARVLIGLVFAMNLQCALAFLIWPATYTPGFELAGVVGEAMVRSLGILFLMWNVPYAVALWDPARHHLALWEALTMQAIGLVGESILFLTLPAGHEQLRLSVQRFILFDTLGLLALGISARLVYPTRATDS